MLLDRELSWPQLAAASVSAVMLPLILHRIFFHKKAHRHSSPASSGSLEDYITKVRTDGNWMSIICGCLPLVLTLFSLSGVCAL